MEKVLDRIFGVIMLLGIIVFVFAFLGELASNLAFLEGQPIISQIFGGTLLTLKAIIYVAMAWLVWRLIRLSFD